MSVLRSGNGLSYAGVDDDEWWWWWGGEESEVEGREMLVSNEA
jgi:hypothetical protein